MDDFDVVVAFTDGFDDNVYTENIPSCVNRQINNGVVTSLSQAADCLAREASNLSKRDDYYSPFVKSWKEAYESGVPMQ